MSSIGKKTKIKTKHKSKTKSKTKTKSKPKSKPKFKSKPELDLDLDVKLDQNLRSNLNQDSVSRPDRGFDSDNTSFKKDTFKKISIETKFQAVMLLHALGDTIGFKNGDWEFNYHDRDKLEMLDYVNELIYEFISLGGVNGINLTEWKVSDDTLFHMAVAKMMLKYDTKKGVTDNFVHTTKLKMWDTAEQIWNEADGTYTDKNGNKIKFNRYIGITTSKNISDFTDDKDARDAPYDDYAGGNGAAMRTAVIGMCLRGEKNRNKLIELSVINSQLTHNNPIGYLGGFNAALFTALAFEDVELKKWPYILLKYLLSDELKEFLSLKNLDQIYDHNVYVRNWQRYIDTRFNKDGNPIKSRANTNPMHRIRYYHDNFYKGGLSRQIGDSGYLCMIMAYDALLDCDGCWEKLIVYAILHSGDSDTVGAVAGALYGAVYGFGDVPQKMLKHIEVKNELEEISNSLYKMYK
jgi:ADP-ribosylarginine hydrolase